MAWLATLGPWVVTAHAGGSTYRLLYPEDLSLIYKAVREVLTKLTFHLCSQDAYTSCERLPVTQGEQHLQGMGSPDRGVLTPAPESLTLHWQRVHSVPCLIQEDPVKRTTFISSRQVLVMSLRMVSAWQGSVTQRGQHSFSGRTLNSHSTSGQARGQQSTSPCCEGKRWQEWTRERTGKEEGQDWEFYT